MFRRISASLVLQTLFCTTIPGHTNIPSNQGPRPVVKPKRKDSKYRPTNLNLKKCQIIRDHNELKEWAEVAYLLKIKKQAVHISYSSSIKGPHEAEQHVTYPLKNFMAHIKITDDEKPFFFAYLTEHHKSGYLEKHKRDLQ